MTDWKPWGEIAPETATCVASNGRFWKRDMVPYEGQFISAEQKDPYFQRLREGVQQPGQFQYAGFWIRFLAKFLDGIINWVISMVINFGLSLLILGSLLFRPQAGTVPPEKFFLYQGVSMLTGIAAGLGYYWFFLSRYGATPGKMALNLKVIRADGSALTNGRIVGRYFAEWISGMVFAIGYIMAGIDEEQHRALHDRICDTRVIKVK